MAVLNSPEPGLGAKLQKATTPFIHDTAFMPAITAQCHASNLLLLRNGDLFCAWFGGSQEGKPDISIYTSRLAKGSDTWAETQQMTFDSTRSEQNPILSELPNGDLWLIYTSQRAGNQDSAVVRRRISRDGGVTWSEPDVLFPEEGTFVRQPIVFLDEKTWVVPTFKCRTEPNTRWIGHNDISAVRVSQDQGKTWKDVEVPDSVGAVHMQIRRLKTGGYYALYRSRWADHIYESHSPDGVNWSAPRPTTLPNPNSGICFDVTASGRIVLVYNDSSRDKATARREGLYDDVAEEGDNRSNQASSGAKEAFWGAPRAPLCVGWSDDDGKTWKSRILQDGDGFCLTNNSEQKLNRELSYPSIAVGSSGTVHIAFTFWRQGIKYVKLGEDFFSEA
jgi:predicted neuraminidase